MPRTKVSRKAPQKQKQIDNDRSDTEQMLCSQFQDFVDFSKKEIIMMWEDIRQAFYDVIDNNTIDLQRKIPVKILNLPMSEVKKLASFRSQDTISMMSKSCVTKDVLNIVNSTTKKKRITRSSSFTDEGPRRSRTRAPKGTASVRASRSLSKSKNNYLESNSKKKTSTLNTPANKMTPNSYGVVTPKCKPNTPLVFLRRPKVGEVALSMQGSPLLTAPVVTENTANINIPLSDGTLLSLQPQNGLRMSQIPDFDQNTLRELDCLRANLEKVFEVTKKRYNLKI
ncbi:hypothetical protein JTB14_007269 [Gonioctena quinquepunctata]|nr:hypothetical protein JTB14_007269 [Gonioctena quinquepunctata]